MIWTSYPLDFHEVQISRLVVSLTYFLINLLFIYLFFLVNFFFVTFM